MEKTDKQKSDTGGAEPLDFGFIKNPPGQMYSVVTHRLHAWIPGRSKTSKAKSSKDKSTILFEPGLGGSSLEWLPLTEQLSSDAQVLLYDRGGYAWSDPGSSPRHIVRLSAETYLLMQAMQIDGPIILVGHSYGGLIMRQLAAIIPNKIQGLVLVDASHEDQFTRMSGKGRVAMLPTSRHFVVSAPVLHPGLREDARRKIQAFSRMRKSYMALHSEISHFGDSCSHISDTRYQFEFPVTVVSRGTDPHTADDDGERNQIWNELQTDLLELSSNSTQVIAEQSGHHIHIDQPELLAQSILQLL